MKQTLFLNFLRNEISTLIFPENIILRILFYFIKQTHPIMVEFNTTPLTQFVK